jgi:hypothetical protein
MDQTGMDTVKKLVQKGAVPLAVALAIRQRPGHVPTQEEIKTLMENAEFSANVLIPLIVTMMSTSGIRQDVLAQLTNDLV